MPPTIPAKPKRLGVVLSVLNEYYQTTIFRGICETALALGYEVFCVQAGVSTDGVPSRNLLFEAVRLARLDGLVVLTAAVLGNREKASVRRLASLVRSIPAVSVGYPLGDLPVISIDNKQSFRSLIVHLLEVHGYRKFLYIGGPAKHADSQARERVFIDVLLAANARNSAVEFRVCYGDFQEESGFQVIQDLHLQFPNFEFDAIVAANDNMAIGARKALRLSENPRWRTCALTGFDDVPLASVEGPPLTTVRQPLREMGSLAVVTLDRLLGGGLKEPLLPLPTTPIFRSSCGCRESARSAPTQEVPSETERLLWIRTERVTGMLQSFGGRLMNAQTLTDVLGIVRTFVSLFSLNSFYLVLFEGWPRQVKTLPRKLKLVYFRSPDRDQQAGPEGLATDLPSLVERCFEDQLATGRILISSLNYGDEEIGLLAFDTSEPHLLHMTSFASILSGALKRIHEMDLRQHHTVRLEREVALRTRDLSTINKLLQEEVHRRTAVQKELEVRQQDLETILEAMPVPLVVTDAGWGPVHYANRAFQSLARGIKDHLPLKAFFDHEPALGSDGSFPAGQLSFGANAGEARTLVVQTAPIHFRGGDEVVVGFLDMTVQKALERDLLRISEHERETVGRDLHDDVCQRMAGVSFLMTALARALESEHHALVSRAREISATLADALLRVRQYARGLFPIELEDSGLVASLRELVSRSSRDDGPQLTFHTNLTEGEALLEPDAELHLYRITQETLNNAVLHSNAKTVTIGFTRTKGALVLELVDNGRGLGQARTGIGMRSMQYRSSQIGAKLTCTSEPGRGTGIRVEVPLPGLKEAPDGFTNPHRR